MTIIAGLPVEYNDRFIRGIAVFAPWRKTPGGSTIRVMVHVWAVVPEPSRWSMNNRKVWIWTRPVHCLRQGNVWENLTCWRRPVAYNFFSHQYSIAVLMANARGNSALWDEHGRLIVRADRGSLLLVGQRSSQGWQRRYHSITLGFFGLEHAMLRIIDTETCGLQGGIVEIASVDVIDGKIVNPMSHLVRPDRPISPQAMAIHRITEAMVADKPWIEDVIPHYYGSEWYVAHNASFDRRVLPEMPGEWICTMKLARRLWPGIKVQQYGVI